MAMPSWKCSTASYRNGRFFFGGGRVLIFMRSLETIDPRILGGGACNHIMHGRSLEIIDPRLASI